MRRYIACVICLMCCWTAAAGAVAAERRETPNATGEARAIIWDTLAGQVEKMDPAWQRRFWELKAISGEVDKYLRMLPGVHTHLHAVLAEAQKKSSALSAQIPLSRTDPVTRAALAAHLGRQEALVQAALQPVRDASMVLSGYQRKLRDLGEAVRAAEKTPPPSLAAGLPAFREALLLAETRLEQLETWLAVVRDPAQELVEHLQAECRTLQTDLPPLWRSYYLKQSVPVFEPTAWLGWNALLEPYLMSGFWNVQGYVPADAPRLVLHWLAFFLPLLWLLRLTDRRAATAARTWAEERRKLLPGVLWFMGGVSLLAALYTSSGAGLPLLLTVGWLATLWGEVRLAWPGNLFGATPETGVDDVPPWPLLVPVPAGLTLLALALPPLLLTLGWLGLLLLCGIWMFARLRRYGGAEFPLRSAGLAGLGLVFLAAFFGWGRLSILLFMLIPGLYTALRLWRGAVAVVNRLPLPAEGTRALSGSLLVSCIMPLVVLGVCGMFSLWILACPGTFSFVADMDATAFEAWGVRVHWADMVLLVAAFYGVYTLTRTSTRLLEALIKRHANMDKSVIPTLQAVLTCCLWTLFAFFALGLLGMDIKSLAFIGGGLSVGVGLGLQHIISNFFSGLVLIFSRIIKGGDLVEIGGVTGRVRSISVRATVVTSIVDSTVVMVPNMDMLTSKLTNWTGLNRHIRKDVPLGVAYGSDPTLVIELLKKLADKQEHILKYPEPQAFFLNFGDSTLNFTLRIWIESVEVMYATLSDLLVDINTCFNEHNIVIAFPQLDVHIKDLPPVTPAPAES